MRVVDLEGKTLMPGLIEGHFHISFWGVRELPDLDLKLPAERTTVYAVKTQSSPCAAATRAWRAPAPCTAST